MATTRFPDTLDAQITEANWTGLNTAIADSRRETGLGLSINAGLNLDVGTGVALVAGMRVEVTSTETVALTDNTVNYIWVQQDGTVYDNTSTTPTAATDLLLGSATTSGGSITAITASRELDGNNGVEWQNRFFSFEKLADIGTGTGTTSLCSLALEPGLYWFRAGVYVDGQALSGGQPFGVGVYEETASESTIEAMILGHFDEGAADQSTWTNGGAQVNFATESNNHPCPVTIMGMLSLADTGALVIKGNTSSFHVFQQSWITARKIR